MSDPEDIDEYKMRHAFWVPPEARWKYLQKNAKQPTIGVLVDDAMDAIMNDYVVTLNFEAAQRRAELLYSSDILPQKWKNQLKPLF